MPRSSGVAPLWDDRLRLGARQSGGLVLALILLGAIRTIGHLPFAPGLIAPAIGLLWVALAGRVSTLLLPSYLIVIIGIVSCAMNGVGPVQYLQLFMVLGGLGIAEYIARQPLAPLARILARQMLWVLLALTAVEYILIQMGYGQRIRSLSGDLTGGILPGIDITVPRFMGVRGGSGYSALLAGSFALICLAHHYRRAAMLYLIVLLLMVSRGPLLGIALALALIPVLRFGWARALGLGVPVLCIASPLLVALAETMLSSAEILFLIDVSTRRFLHYMSFLHFGLENPIWGIGYANYQSAYASYFYDAEFQQWGFTNFALIRESHNFMLDILGELGVLAYLLASLQVWLIARTAFRGDARYGPLIVFVTTCFMFLSGLSNWTWWFAIGVIMAHDSAQRGTR